MATHTTGALRAAGGPRGRLRLWRAALVLGAALALGLAAGFPLAHGADLIRWEYHYDDGGMWDAQSASAIEPLGEGRVVLVLKDQGVIRAVRRDLTVETEASDAGLYRPDRLRLVGEWGALVADTANDRVVEFWSSEWQRTFGPGIGAGGALSMPSDARRLDGGETLISDQNNSRLILLGANGDFLRQFGPASSDGVTLELPFAFDLCAPDRLMVADPGKKRLIEVQFATAPDPNQPVHVVWHYGAPDGGELEFPTQVRCLPDGGLLVADALRHRVLELAPDRASGFGARVVWSYPPVDGGVLPGGELLFPFDVARTEWGNTLILDRGHHRVIEVGEYEFPQDAGHHGELDGGHHGAAADAAVGEGLDAAADAGVAPASVDGAAEPRLTVDFGGCSCSNGAGVALSSLVGALAAFLLGTRRQGRAASGGDRFPPR